MSTYCDCNASLSNTGAADCQPIQDVARLLILVPLRDSSNNLNRIDLTSIPDDAGITALINATDDRARWYPLIPMESVNDNREDPIIQSFDSGTQAKIRDGVRTFQGEILEQGSTYAGLINKFGCTKLGAYIIDAQGQLIGNVSVAGYVSPIEISMPSWDVRTMNATDTTIPTVMLKFQWAQTVGDGDLGLLLPSDFGGADLLSYEGLLDLKGELVGSPAATSFKMKVFTKFGSAASPVVAKNLAQTDFAPYNVTDSAAVTVTSMTESPKGTYEFNFASLTGKVLSNRIASGTNGYSDTEMRDVVITLP